MQKRSAPSAAPKSAARRKFIGQFGVTTTALTTGLISVEPLFKTERSLAGGATIEGSNRRANDCAKLRRDAAQVGLQSTPQNLQHPPNGDESLYANKIANYSKGLPHNSDGTVLLSAYEALLKALYSGQPSDFDAIPMAGDRRLTNPQSG